MSLLALKTAPHCLWLLPVLAKPDAKSEALEAGHAALLCRHFTGTGGPAANDAPCMLTACKPIHEAGGARAVRQGLVLAHGQGPRRQNNEKTRSSVLQLHPVDTGAARAVWRGLVLVQGRVRMEGAPWALLLQRLPCRVWAGLLPPGRGHRAGDHSRVRLGVCEDAALHGERLPEKVYVWESMFGKRR